MRTLKGRVLEVDGTPGDVESRRWDSNVNKEECMCETDKSQT